MARQFNLFGRHITITKRLFGYGKEDSGFAVIQQKFGASYSERALLKKYRRIVYACISLIAETIAAQYEPEFYKPKGDGMIKEKDHELLRLLKRPAGRDVTKDPSFQFNLLEATIILQLLQGSVYWYMGAGEQSGKPREIVVLRADRVGKDIDPNTGDVTGYFIRREGDTAIPLKVEEVLPFEDFNPDDPYKGLSTTEAGEEYIDTDELTAKFTRNFFNNNAGLSGLLQVKGEVTKGAFKKFVSSWRAKYEGIDAAGKLAIIRDSDASFTKIGLGLDELDMSSLRKMSQEDVAMMFKVPLPLLGRMPEGAGFGRANIEALEYIFAKYNIDVKMGRIDDILDFALERYYKITDWEVRHKDIIPADKEYELNYRDKAVDRWMTRDEIREEQGRDKIPGGDQLFVPMANVPINEASLTASTDPAAKNLDTNKPLVFKRIIRDTKKKDLTFSVEQKENFRLKLTRNQKLYERKYSKALEPVIRAQKKEALTNLEAHASSLHKDLQQQLFDDAAYDLLIQEAIKPVLTNLADQQGSIALKFAGDDQSEFRYTVKLSNILENSTKRMAKNFNDETLAKLNKTLVEGIAEGEALSKLKDRVEQVYEGAEGYRAERIARTETLKASNESTNEAYRQTEYVTGKQWYVNPGADEECAAFDGKTIGLDDTFIKQGQSFSYTDSNGEEQTVTNDYDDVDSPPLHPNCRCTIIPVR